MVENETYFIRKVTVDVFTGSMESGRLLERNIRGFLEEQVFPIIENYLYENIDISPSDDLLIDTFSLDFRLPDVQGLDGYASASLLKKQVEDQLRPLLSQYRLAKQDTIKGTTDVRSELGSNGLPKVLEEHPENKESTSDLRFLSGNEKSFSAWLFFLEHGHVPWWATDFGRHEMEWENKLNHWVSLPRFSDRLKATLQLPTAQLRIFLQHSPSEITWLLKQIGSGVFNVAFFEGEITQLPVIQKKIILVFMLFVVLYKGQMEERQDLLKNLIRHLLVRNESKIKRESLAGVKLFLERVLDERANHEFRPLIEKTFQILDPGYAPPASIGHEAFSQEPTSQYPGLLTPSKNDMLGRGEDVFPLLDHAGLVLLHPFLSSFFRDCGILDSKGKLTDAVLAIHLLYYAATKRERPMEYELLFEKFICGWDFHAPVERDLGITPDQKEKVEYLISSLIDNWKKIKNTGTETIRTEFLQRPGKLIKEGDAFRLMMERKVQDILLEGLPYSLGVVKLPWRKELIFIEW